jgi:galactokinase
MKSLHRLAKWRSLFADPPGPVYDQLCDIYGGDEREIRRRLPMWTGALEGFAQNYSPQAEVLIARAPGRVNLLGMHIDHRGGAVNTLGVGDTILVAKPRDDDLVVLRNASGDFPSCEFRIRQELPPGGVGDWDKWTIHQYELRQAAGTQADWSNYVRAAVLYLQHLNTASDGAFSPALKGMNVFVNGDVRPGSGLSSSSTIVVASMEACASLNELDMSAEEFVEAAHMAEWYVGTRGGGGDHAAIKFCKHGCLAHLGAFPLTVNLIPFPEDYCAVLCDSMVVSAKTAGARNLFNQRVACYELGMLILRKSFPQHAEKMQRMRDVNPPSLGVDEGAVYQMLKALPEAAEREELSVILADQPDELERIYRSHEPVGGGYRIRQACLYGIAECLRSERAVELLQSGDVEGFAELITLSHDGDRVTHLVDGRREPLEKPLGEAALDRLIADVRSSDPARRERASLYRQPGGYDASCPELDEMVDIALSVPGLCGAGLVGAGLGGCVVVLRRKDQAEAIIAAMEERYYRPRGLPTKAQVCPGVGGSGVLDVE